MASGLPTLPRDAVVADTYRRTLSAGSHNEAVNPEPIQPPPTTDRSQIAAILAELADDCEVRFSRPPSTRQTPRASRAQYNLQLEELESPRPRSYENAIMASMNRLEGRDRPPHSGDASEDWVPELGGSHSTSKRSSFSRPNSGQNGVADSAVSLPHQKDSRVSNKSHLRETHSADDDTAPPPGTNGPPPGPGGPPEPKYPGPAKTALIMVSIYISIFLVALDRTIMGPAVPAITNEFNSIADIGWYGSSYMLTSAGFILLYGRIYTFFPTKPIFLSGILLFEIGSAVCGAARSSIMLIIGRAIAGLGSSGIFTGGILIMMNTVPLHRRPMLQGLFGACFGVASVAGPLLGGAFTGSSATWRWCFYINLPLGALTILVVIFVLKLDEHKPKLANWKETIKNLDPVGTILFLPSITCLLLALEWGAAEYPWSAPRMVALLVVFAVLFIAFIAWQYYTRNTTATVPSRIVTQRSVAFGGASQFCVGSTMLTFSLYIPLWFQAIKGESAMQSGINTIPLVLSVVVGSILSGGLVQRFGYYTPFMILGSCLMSVGAGLITTWNMHASSGMWIGYQVMLGFGVGCTMQHPNLAVQVVLPRQDVPIGTAVLSLCQTLGGAVFAAVGQNLYISKFSNALDAIGGLDTHRILASGATSLTQSVPPALRESVLGAYNHSLTQGTFFAALIIACLSLPAALGMEWRSVKEQQKPPQSRQAPDEEKQMPGHISSSGSSRDSPANGDAAEDTAPAPPKLPAWQKAYRASGQFSGWLTARINPDLRGDRRSAAMQHDTRGV